MTLSFPSNSAGLPDPSPPSLHLVTLLLPSASQISSDYRHTDATKTHLGMILLKTILSAAAVLLLSCQVDAAPVELKKRLLLPGAPLASDIDGAHLLLKNDVDSTNIIKNAYLLLSKPRNYYDGMSACLSMGDGKRSTDYDKAIAELLSNAVFAHMPSSVLPWTCQRE